MTTEEKIFHLQQCIKSALKIDLDRIRQRTRHKEEMKMRYAVVCFANHIGLLSDRMDMYFIFRRSKTTLYDAKANHEKMLKNNDAEYISMYSKLEREHSLAINKHKKSVQMLPEKRFAFPEIEIDEWIEKLADCFNRHFGTATPLRNAQEFLNDNWKGICELYYERLFPYNAVLKIIQEKYA
jgi:hypothetical protein